MNTTQKLKQLMQEHQPEDMKTLNRYLALKEVTSSLPRVAVLGASGSGKSLLINCLTNQLDKATSTTHQVEEVEHQGISFIDTPSLNDNLSDRSMIKNAALTADIIIYTHALSSGLIPQADLDTLEKLAPLHYDYPQLRVVFTHKDTVEENSQLVEDIIEQLLDNLAIYEVLELDLPSYIKGKQEGNESLITASGLPPLQQHLHELLAEVSSNPQKTRAYHLRELHDKLIAATETDKEYFRVRKRVEKIYQDNHEPSFINALQKIRLELLIGENIPHYFRSKTYQQRLQTQA